MSTSGDTMSTSGDVHCIRGIFIASGGYHDAYGGSSW